MSRVVVVGAGVVGQVYAGLLAEAGHEVCLVARGERAKQLRSAGVVLERDGDVFRPTCRVGGSIDVAGAADVIIVAVRGDQLESVRSDVGACRAPTVVCLTNPIGGRTGFERQVGVGRTVFGFSGIGGLIDDYGVVRFHVVRQQPTVVDVAAARGPIAVGLLTSTALPLRRETQMAAWLATHSVFIAGIGSVLLSAETGSDGVAGSREVLRELVVAISEAFDELESRGHPVRPLSLRTIFGRMPTWFATGYWRRQFAGPMVRVSIEPHVLATRESEFPQIVDFALSLVGDGAPRFRHLLDRGA